jgi:hypothetical protein
MAKLLRCEVVDGPRNGFKAISIPSVTGEKEYLSIEEAFLVRCGSDLCLPVRLIGEDQSKGFYLIQLPVEADSGANRVWVNNNVFYEPSKKQVYA